MDQTLFTTRLTTNKDLQYFLKLFQVFNENENSNENQWKEIGNLKCGQCGQYRYHKPTNRDAFHKTCLCLLTEAQSVCCRIGYLNTLRNYPKLASMIPLADKYNYWYFYQVFNQPNNKRCKNLFFNTRNTHEIQHAAVEYLRGTVLNTYNSPHTITFGEGDDQNII